jgi:hypothetical protein
MCDEFARISKLDSNEVPAQMSHLDRMTWLVVTLRYKKDNSGFCSIFEEAVGDCEHAQVLISGLKWLEADDIAELFTRALDLLRAKGKLRQGWYWEFEGELYDQIDAIGDELGDRMYELDDKLEPLLRQQAAERQRV